MNYISLAAWTYLGNLILLFRPNLAVACTSEKEEFPKHELEKRS